MKTILAAVAALAAALGTAACAPMHGQSGQPGERMAQRCTEHRQMMQGKSPEQQRAAVDAYIKERHGSSDPQHVERHLRMMESHCGPAVRSAS